VNPCHRSIAISVLIIQFLKSKGQTEISPGLTFVSLTRVPHVSDLCVEPFPYSRVQRLAESPSLIQKLAEMERLASLAKETQESIEAVSLL
jgi:hypothetical protein